MQYEDVQWMPAFNLILTTNSVYALIYSWVQCSGAGEGEIEGDTGGIAAVSDGGSAAVGSGSYPPPLQELLLPPNPLPPLVLLVLLQVWMQNVC